MWRWLCFDIATEGPRTSQEMPLAHRAGQGKDQAQPATESVWAPYPGPTPVEASDGGWEAEGDVEGGESY